ncbi:phenylalanine--tRNA ligase subunit alpha [candidate division WWE3 bacterium RBG_19FT_COMBO_34_6]|uniref:phenylalanine--tRNA ligase n=1 Tax=candidate division WWE3 bacterium RBG_19FT_COMBO_34_6 TaxID=1802612 RepID=A0A1F4UL08_UNCKA|nr:MAG: phenylalanine--tRNA ligase subunit alpha [candidate division WWE3 bacterium RBG_19FT_COMBO_34_6]
MDEINSNIENIKNTFTKSINDAKSTYELENLYLDFFSKKSGKITLLIKKLADLNIEEKKKLGPVINQLQNEFKLKIDQRKKEIKDLDLKNQSLDFTYPLKAKSCGYLHPLTQTVREIDSFFRYYGYSVVEGPEIETEEYNFRKLNLPKGHPATDLQDSLYIKGDILLRPHTSSVEARILTDYKPPIKVVIPGKCFRNETPNSTNASFFHQYQGVAVDKDINLQHLKGILQEFHKFLFGEDIKLRFRYKYYPEVSPGMGVDMKCKFCNGKGCPVCKYRGWIEVLGSGMIHYNTLKMCGIDPEKYTGFAFGMGLDRLVMQKFGIDDIRKLYGGIIYK